MKRIISLLLICCLAMALSVGAFAAGKTEYPGGLSLSADTVEIGKTVDVTMSFPADQLATVQLGISFETDYLKVTAIDAPGEDELTGYGLYAASDVDTANANGLVTIAYVGAKGDNVLEFGEAKVTITFEALAVGTTTISVAGEDEHPMIIENLASDGYTPDMEYTPETNSVTLTITEPSHLRGDLNNDGKVNVTDNTLMLRHIKGTKLLTGDALAWADLNGDGKVNVTDNTLMLRHIKGTKSLWE